MTTETSRLVLAVDSSQVKAGGVALNSLAMSGAKAETATKSLASATNTLAAAARSAAAIFGLGFGVQQLISLSDQYTKFTAQLRLATNNQREFSTALADVRRISSLAQSDLAATGVLYARITNAVKELGLSQKKVADVTETISLALKSSGATAVESASAMLQLSQGFASGVLRGQEFNQVSEAAPRLMKALADGMGAPIGQLRKMAEAGQLTSQALANALPRSLEILRVEALTVQTISGAFSDLNNKIMEFVGSEAQTSNAVKTINSAVNFLTNNLNLLAGAFFALTSFKVGGWLGGVTTNMGGLAVQTYASITAARALTASTIAVAQAQVKATAAASALAAARVVELNAAVLATTGNMRLAVTTNGLVPAITQAAIASGAHTAALAGLTAATGAASVSGGVLRGVLGFFGGPIGAIITGLGLAATAWTLFGDKAKEAAGKAEKAVVESSQEMIARLDQQIAKLKERSALLNAVPEIKDASEANIAGIARSRAAIEEDAITGGYNRIILLSNYMELLKKVAEAEKLVADAANKTREVQISEWYAENGSKAQQLAAELDKLRIQFGTIPPEMERLVRAKFVDKRAIKDLESLTNAATDYIKKLKEEAEEAGLTEGQIFMLNATRAAAAAPVKELSEQLMRQAAATLQVKESTKAAEDTLEGFIRAVKESNDQEKAGIKTTQNRIQALLDETFLITATVVQTRELTIQRDLETAGLEKGTAAWKEYEARLRSALDGQRLAKDNADAIKKMDAQWDKFTDDIKRSMTDSIVRAFENGESAGKVFFDSLRRAAMTALIKIPVDFAVDSASGFLRSAIGGAAGASAGGSLAGSFGASGGGGMLGGIGAGVAGLSLLQGTGAAGQAMMGNAFMSTSRFFGAGAGTQGAFGNAGANFANPTNVLGSFAANMALNQILGNRGIGADIGSTIGGVAGSFLPIPGGTIIGAATGNIIGGMFGGGTQNSNAGGRISEVNGQFSAAGIQGDRPSGTMIADITNVLTTVASVLNEFTATLGTLQTGNTDYASFIDTLGSRGITDASGIIREVITSNLIEGITEAEKAIIAGTSDALAGLREVAAVRLQTTTSNVFRDDLAALRKSLEDPKQSQIDLLNIERDGMIARARALTDGTQALADIEAIYQFKLTDINKQFATSVVTVISDVIEIAGLRLDAANDNLSRASSIVTKAVEAERAGVTGRYNVALKLSQTALDGLTKSAQRLASIAALLKGAIPDIPGQEGASRIAGQVTLSAALAAARAGGALPDEETLRRALDAVAKPSEGLFSNFVDYQRDFITTANDIANLSDIAEWQRMSADLSVTTAQTALEQDRAAYDAELVRLDGILSSAQDQIDAVNGTTIAVMSIEDAIRELALALTGARAAGGAVAAANPVNSLFRGLLGRNADQAGAAHFDAALAGGQSSIDVAQNIIRSQEFANSHRTVQSLYSIFGSGRAPDAEGMAYWSAQLASGAQSLEEIALNFTRGQEYADLVKVRGFASGGSHAGGMRIVGERGPELEFTGPSQIFSNGKSEAMLDNSAVVSELKQMRTELNAVLISIAAKTVDTDARYRKWDTVGLPPTRVT